MTTHTFYEDGKLKVFNEVASSDVEVCSRCMFVLNPISLKLDFRLWWELITSLRAFVPCFLYFSFHSMNPLCQVKFISIALNKKKINLILST